MNFIKNHRVKLALCMMLIAALFVTPLLTQAQYKWKLNGHTIIAAKELYFDGNYMHDSTRNTSYHTTGWDGGTKPMKQIEIRNFENALLANKEDEDVEYVLSWQIETYVLDEHGTIRVGENLYRKADSNERFEIKSVRRTAADKEIEGAGDRVVNNASSITGLIVGNGNPKKDLFDFELSQPAIYESGQILPWNSFIQITLTAKNVAFQRDANGHIMNDAYGNAQFTPSDSYAKNISCVFEYVLSSGEGYVSRFDPVDDSYDKLKVWIGTGEIPDSQARDQIITVWWDKRKLKVDPFNVVFVDMRQKEAQTGTPYYFDQYGEGELENYAALTITGLASYYTGYLDFFKMGSLDIRYAEEEGGEILSHVRAKSEPWFYTYTNGSYQIMTRSLLVADSAGPGSEAAAGCIIGYYVGAKDADIQ